MPIVVSGSGSAVGEGLILNGLNLNDVTNYNLLDPLEMPPPRKRQEWVTGADADGAGLVRDPLFENRQITPRIRIAPQASMDSALALIAAISDQMEEAEKNEGGIPLVWTPTGSAKTLTFYVLSGEFVEGPDVDKANWFRQKPIVAFRLDCRPFGYEPEVTSAATVTNTNRFQILTLANVPGDVPAEARLVITDAATQSRRHIEWGLQQIGYDPATNLSIDSFVTSGFGGTSTARAGSFNTNVIRGTLTTSPIAICGVGNLGHVGTYRVKARVYGVGDAGVTLYARLAWREGDGPLRASDTASIALAGATTFWQEIDLGLITIPTKTLGTQRWTGQIEAYASAYSSATAYTLDVDYLTLIPVGEGYGKARSTFTFQSFTSYSAHDEFDQTAGALVGKTLPVGGTWAGAGDADDFSVETSGKTAQRTAVSDTDVRYATASTPSLTEVIAQVDFKLSALSSDRSISGALARYTDISNHIKAYYAPDAPSGLYVDVRVAGSSNIVGPFAFTASASTWYTVRLHVATDGAWAAWIYPQGVPSSAPVAVGAHSSLATGGALATGKVGFVDYRSGASAVTRNYDNFVAGAGVRDAVVFSGRTAEIRHDSAIRQDSTGTYYGPVQIYRGSRFYVPAAGSANRTSRILVKARRNDIDVMADDQIADSTTATISYTPRYLVVPR